MKPTTCAHFNVEGGYRLEKVYNSHSKISIRHICHTCYEKDKKTALLGYKIISISLGFQPRIFHKPVTHDTLARFCIKNAFQMNDKNSAIFTEFQEHHLETVAVIEGVSFINDSKATNVNATWFALESMRSPVILIMGGVDKGNDYSMLDKLMKKKVKAIVCLGNDNKKIQRHFKNMVLGIHHTKSMNNAVMLSRRLAKKEDTILLSPANASFDLFENYQDRGRQFKEIVKSI